MNIEILAFYLPQFRPIKENNEWFGEGFTEWTNVAKSIPLFKGHYQPKIPADLGFYDLRLQGVKNKQAELAKEAGISAFCYYHYWFGNGKTILEKCLQEIVANKEPNFPFCLCWANESWYKKLWHSDVSYLSQELLLDQTYGGENDYEEHFYFLLDAFKDERYYKIDGKLTFVIYNHGNFPDVENFKHVWQRLAKENNLPEFFFVSYSTNIGDVNKEIHVNYDAMILSLFKSPLIGSKFSKKQKFFNAIRSHLAKFIGKPLLVFDYAKNYHKLVSDEAKLEDVYPVLVPNWDNSPRRGAGGMIYTNSTPENFQKHAEQVFETIKDNQHQVVFLKSWNEWGEGNYMEPDLKYGKGYIYALRNALKKFSK